MFKKIVIVLLLLLPSAGAAQESIQAVLRQIETNNLSLQARSSLTRAQTLEARVGNSLSDPNVEFVHQWGNPSSLGKTGELTVTQEFDFPTSYAHRNKLARTKADQYAGEMAAYRQQVLLEAEMLCIQIVALRQQRTVLRIRENHAQKFAEIHEQRYQTGEGSVLERNEAAMQLVDAQNALKLLEIDLQNALSRLKNLNGGEEIQFPDTIFGPRPLLRPLEELQQLYETADPSLQAIVAEQMAAGEEVKVSRSESLPKLAVGYKHEFGPGERFNGVIVGMSVPMFGNRNNVKRAKAQAEYATSQLESSRIDLKTQVATLYARAETLAESLSRHRAIAQETIDYDRFLEKALETGEISVVEYFTQLETLLRVQETIIGFERDYRLVCAELNAIEL